MSNRKRAIHGGTYVVTWNRVRSIKLGELDVARQFAKDLGVIEFSDAQAVSILRAARRALRRIDCKNDLDTVIQDVALSQIDRP